MSALMEIIIKGVDQASSVASKVTNTFQGAADRITSAHNKAAQSTEKLSQAYQKVESTGMSAYAQLNAKQQEYYQKISQSEAKLESLAGSGTKIGNTIASGMNVASNAMTTVHGAASSLKSTIQSTTVGSHLVSGLESAHSKITAFKSKFDEIKGKATEVGSHIGSALGRGLDTAKSKVQSLNESLGTIGQGITAAVGAIGMGSIYQLTVGLGMAREQMLTLMTATTGSASEAQKLVSQLDQITNKSVVGLSELGNAMNSIKISTGMTTNQLSMIAPTVDKVGQAAILMGKDTGTAQELMVASFRGLNGEFEMLKTNFGITKQTLMDAGWSGASTDVEGYNTALASVLDKNLNLDGVMDSTTGKIEKIKKAFRTAGKVIGEQVVPYIEKAAEWFLALTQQFPGLTTGLILIAAGFMGFLTVLPVLGYLIGALKSLAIFLGIVKTEEDALTLSQVRQRVSSALSTAWAYAQAAALYVLGAATAVYNFIMGEGTIATKIATVAQWLWNAALSANPIMIVVIAIIALIAILAYLYTSNETVRNAINWLWAGLQQLGGYIYGGLLAAWNALVGALTWVWGILVQVGSFIMGTLMSAWNSFATAISPITAALGLLWTALQKVFGGWLSGKAGEANGIFQALGGAVAVVWGALSQLASIVGAILAPYFERLMIVLRLLWAFLGTAFAAVWRTIGGVIMAVINYVATFITILANLLMGNITIGQALGQIWGAIQLLFFQVFQAIITGIGAFAMSLISWAMQAGAGLVNGFITFLASLPGRAWTWLMNTINQVGNFARAAWAYAQQAGSNIVNAIAGYLSSLPGRMYQWGVNALRSFVDAIINSIPGLRDALNMVSSLFPHSPPKEGPLSTIKPERMKRWMATIGAAMDEGFLEGSDDPLGFVGTPMGPTVNKTVSAKVPESDKPVKLELIVKHVFDFKNFREVTSVLTKEEVISVLKSCTYNLEWIDVLVKTLTNAKNITKMNLG